MKAFIPAPLPPRPPVELPPPVHALLERALVACGRLDAIATLLPDPSLFLYAYVRREAVLSSQIEGTQSTLSDLLIFELREAPGLPADDVVEVSNYVAAIEHAIKRLADGMPLCNRLLREVHGKLLASGRGARQSPGEFRTTQNWIGGGRPGNAHFVPPPPHEVAPCMSELERFLHEPCAHGTLVKAALAHVQFETIHPFLDGNGRVGRILIALMLHNDGVLRRPLLYLSLYLKQHRAEYYSHLDRVRTEGAWVEWIEFYLRGVEETARGAVETARRLVSMFDEDSGRIQTTGRAAANALRAFTALKRSPIASIERLAAMTGTSFPTAARAVATLEGLGILREVTGRRRDRVFAYDRYLATLSEGAQPLR